MQKAGAVLLGLGLIQAVRGKSVRPPLALASFLGLFKFGKRFLESHKQELIQAGVPAKVVETLPGALAAAVGLGFAPSAAGSLWIIWLWIRVLRFTLPQVCNR